MPEWNLAYNSAYIDVNGLKLHYYRSGSHNKPPLILCHGLTDNALCWIRAAQVLQEMYDLIMIDARGHGLSAAATDSYTEQGHAHDLVGLIKGLALQRPNMIGHSMGAATVGLVAAHHPGMVGRIILEDPPWSHQNMVQQPLEQRQASLAEWRADLEQQQLMPPAAQLAAGHELHPTWHDLEFGPWCESTRQVKPEALSYVLEPRTPWPELVSKIVTPTLLITADVEAGALVAPKTAQAIAQQQPHIKVVQLNNAGHNIRREQFEPYLQAVTTFLAA